MKWLKHNKVCLLIGACIFAVPLSSMVVIRGTNIWYSQYLGLLTCFGLAASFVLWKFNKFISMFTILCLVSGVSSNTPISLFVMFQIYFGALACYGIARFTTSKQRKILLWCIFAMTIIQGLMVILQSFNMDPIFDMLGNTKIDDTVGFNGSHNQLGNWFAITSPIIWYLCPEVIMISIFGLWNSTTSSAFIGFSVATVIQNLFRSRVWFYSIIAILLFSSIFFMVRYERISTEAIGERYNLLRNSITLVEQEYANLIVRDKRISGNAHRITSMSRVKCNKWLGYGLGSFIRMAPYTQDRIVEAYHRYLHAHNDFIEVYFELGRLGFILVALWLLDLIRRFVFSIKTDISKVSFYCLVAYAVCAMGVFTVHTAVTGYLLIVILGLFEGEYRDGKITEKS